LTIYASSQPSNSNINQSINQSFYPSSNLFFPFLCFLLSFFFSKKIKKIKNSSASSTKSPSLAPDFNPPYPIKPLQVHDVYSIRSNHSPTSDPSTALSSNLLIKPFFGLIMDVLGVNYKVLKNNKRSSSYKRRTGGINCSNNYKKGIKVVYISSPMMVKTSASKFRDLVQELTGKDSDATRFMDDDFDHAHDHDHDHHHHQNSSFVEIAADHGIRAVDVTSSPSMVPNLMDSCSYEGVSPPSSSTCSDSTFEPFDGFMEGSFMSMLQSNLFFDASQLDVIT